MKKYVKCSVCSHQTSSILKEVITPELSRVWKLENREKAAFDRRESSFCLNCGCSLRSRKIAEAIMASFPEARVESLDKWTGWASTKGLKIAEINYCGQLHPFLKTIPGLVTSQYCEHTWRGALMNLLSGIRREDITQLSFADDSFDLVLHSEVLEHIADYKKALSECRRILKPGGICLFTVPLIMRRKTKQKAFIDAKTYKIKYIGKPSYHGSGEKDNLVFWEFGKDFVKENKLKTVVSAAKDLIWVWAITK